MKKVGIIKRIFALLLIFLLSINSFAAVVSDNDGSAFITKAEFDSLKNNFQAQIDSYNTSIDSKIDGAIAQYLAGIKLANEAYFSPYFEIKIGNEYDIIAPQTGVNNTKQIYSQASLAFVYLAGAWTFNSLNPISWGSSTSYPDNTRWGLFIKNLSNYFTPKGIGWVIDSTTQDVIIKKYNKDYIFSSLTSQDRGNANMQTANEIADHIFFFTEDGGNGDHLNTLYNTGLSVIGTSWNAYDSYWTHTKNYIDFSDERQRPHYKDTRIANYLQGLKQTDSPYDNWGWKHTNDLYTADNNNWGNSRIHVHVCEDEDKTIFLYNKVNDQIYAYLDGAQTIETFTDKPQSGVYDVSERGDNCNLLVDSGYEYPQIAGEWWSPGYPDRIYAAVPKYKLKNEATLTSSKPDATTKFNKLESFRNGLLRFTVGSVSSSPRFYGGLPLFTLTDDPTELTFNINVQPTTASYTGAIKVWVKEGEFLNEDNFSSATWTTAEKNKIITLTGDASCTANADGSISIPSDTQITLKTTDIEPNKTYYLRFCEANKTYGGKIKYLSDFQYVKE